MSDKKPSTKEQSPADLQDKSIAGKSGTPDKEVGGYADQGLLEPTRYSDWEVNGRCSDF